MSRRQRRRLSASNGIAARNAAGERGGLSPDGRWLAYGITRTNGDNDLRVTRRSPTAPTKTIAFGVQPAFSADSKWLAVAAGVSEAQQEKLRKEKKPVHRSLPDAGRICRRPAP